jgi:hypothetical protein
MAVEDSVKQMALLRDGVFCDRLCAMMSRVAGQVLTEAAATPHHSGRASYAQRVTTNPHATAMTAGPQVVMGPNIVQTTTYDEATQTSTCTATDPALEAQIVAYWNSLAGLDTAV